MGGDDKFATIVLIGNGELGVRVTADSGVQNGVFGFDQLKLVSVASGFYKW